MATPSIFFRTTVAARPVSLQWTVSCLRCEEFSKTFRLSSLTYLVYHFCPFWSFLSRSPLRCLSWSLTSFWDIAWSMTTDLFCGKTRLLLHIWLQYLKVLCFGFSMLLCVLCSLDAATLPTSGETRPGIGAPSGACSGRREGETTRSSCPRTGVCLRLHYIS